MPRTTTDSFSATSKYDERHQQLSMLRDKLRQNGGSHNNYDPMHTPRTPRSNSVASEAADLTPRRGGVVVGATTASNFKAVYD